MKALFAQSRQGRAARRFYAVMLMASLLLTACSFLAPQSEPDGAGGGAAVIDTSLTCRNVSLAQRSGRPTNAIGLGAIPADFGPVPALEVVDAQTDDSIVIPVDGQPGRRGATFVVPVHPNQTAQGGPVRLTLIDGDGQACGPWDFTIDPLPQQPGAFAEMVELVERIYDEVDRLYAGPVLGPEPDAGDSSQVPFELAEDWLRGPDNENSLKKIADGEAEISADITPEAQAIMDGLVAESGLLEAWDEWAQELAQRPNPPDPAPEATADPATTPPSFAEAGIEFCRTPTAGELAILMRDQQEMAHFRQTRGRFLGAAGTLAGVVGLASLVPTAGVPNPVTLAAGGIGLGITIVDVATEAGESLLPSEFTRLAFNYEKPVYWEDDEPMAGSWSDVMTVARSKGMSLDGIILNVIMKRVGGAFSKAFAGKHVSNQVVKASINFQGRLAGSAAAKQTMKRLGDREGLIPIPGCNFGPTDISDPAYHYGELVPEGAIGSVIEDSTALIIDDVGEGQLIIHADPEAFSGNTISTAEPVEVKPIEVIIDPTRASGDPGFTASFIVTVHNANDPSINIAIEPQGGHLYDVVPLDDNEYMVTVVTSQSANDFPAVLRVESASTGGLRGEPGAEPRFATARLSSSAGDVAVTPWAACVAAGDTLQMSAAVTGFENQAVSWSADRGSISPQGLFRAPGEEGPVTVRATSVADSSISGQARLTVAETCQCWAAVDLPMHGIFATTDNLSMAFGSQRTGRQDQVQAIKLDFTGQQGRLDDVMWLEFFSGPSGLLDPTGEGPRGLSRTPFSAIGDDGTYSEGQYIYYEIVNRGGGLWEYYEVPRSAGPNHIVRPTLKYIPPEERTFVGPEVGQTGRFLLGVEYTQERPQIVNEVFMAYPLPGGQRFSTESPGTVIERVAKVVRPLWRDADSGDVYDRHQLEFTQLDFSSPQALQFALPVGLTPTHFIQRDDGTYEILAEVRGEVAVFEADNTTFTRGPIRARIQGVFGDPRPSIFGGDDSRDLFYVERERLCITDG